MIENQNKQNTTTEIFQGKEVTLSSKTCCKLPIHYICLYHGHYCWLAWYSNHINCKDILRINPTDLILDDLQLPVKLYSEIYGTILQLAKSSDLSIVETALKQFSKLENSLKNSDFENELLKWINDQSIYTEYIMNNIAALNTQKLEHIYQETLHMIFQINKKIEKVCNFIRSHIHVLI